MIQRMTSNRLTARAQFGSLLLAGLLSGSGTAQVPLPVANPLESSASGQLGAPPSLDYVPAAQGAVVPAHKSVVSWLGLNRHSQKPATSAGIILNAPGPKTTAAIIRNAPGALPELPSEMRAPIQLVGHESKLTAPADAVIQAQATAVVATNSNAQPKVERAVVGAPVSAQPFESLLDVDLSKHLPTIGAPAPKVDMPASDGAQPTRVEIHETFSLKNSTSNNSFHLSDNSPVDEPTMPLPGKIVSTQPPAPPAPPARTKAFLTAAPVLTPAKFAESATEPKPLVKSDTVPVQKENQTGDKTAADKATTAGIATSTSQRPISLRIGSTKITAQSPTTRVFEQRTMVSEEPVINAQPVVRAVKPILTAETAQNDKIVKSGTVQAASVGQLATETQPATKLATTGMPTRSLVTKAPSMKSSTADTDNTSTNHTSTKDTSTKNTSTNNTSASPATKAQLASAPSTTELAGTKLPTLKSSTAEQTDSELTVDETESDELPVDGDSADELAMDDLSTDEFSPDERPVEPKLAIELNRRIKKMFPGSRVEVKTDDEGLVVDGVAASNAEARKILALVRKTSLCPVSDRVITKR